MRLHVVTPEMIAATPGIVAGLVPFYNEGLPLPAEIRFGGKVYPTAFFLGEIIPHNAALAELPARGRCQDDIVANAVDVAGQAQDLLAAALRKGLLEKTADAASDLSGDLALHGHLLSRGNAEPTVTIAPRSGVLSAGQEAEVAATVAGNAEARRLYEESTGRRSFAAPVEPQPAPSSGMFDRSAFRDQTAS